MYWRHIVASSIPGGSNPDSPTSQPTAVRAAPTPAAQPESRPSKPAGAAVALGKQEQAGSTKYQERHYAQVLQQGLSFSGFERDHLFLNSSAGPGKVSFSEVSSVSGADNDTDGRGVLVADLDDDGDDDLVITTLQRRRFHVLRNERTGGESNRFIKLRLKAKGDNTRGIGAMVTVRQPGGPRSTVRPRMAGGGFASQRGEWMTFGAGPAKTVDVDVLWPGGARTAYRQLATNARYQLVEDVPTARPVEAVTFALPDPPPPGLSGVVAKPGAPLPPLRLTDAKGQAAPWSPPPGKPAVVHLWATWCKSCQQELPDLVKIKAELATTHPGVPLQTISMEPGDHARVATYLSDRGFDLPSHVADPDDLSAIVSPDGMLLPTTLIIDAQGRLVEGLQGTLAVAGIPAALARLR